MSGVMRKGVLLLVVAFIGFYMFTDPHGLATVAKTGGGRAWDLLTQLFTHLIAFLDTVMK